jgi:tRNA-splicing ligase RtcB
MNRCSTLKKWVGHKLDVVIERRLRRLADAEDVVHVAVMPDVHLAGDVCNGVVVATESKLFPQAVGGDIGCGYLSVALGVDADVIDQDIAAFTLMKLHRAVPINKHSNHCKIPIEGKLSSPRLEKFRSREGSLQLGTLGRGNHFVELQSDQSGRLWLLIHSGSRAMGQLISAHHLRDADVDTDSGLKFLNADSGNGQTWLNDQQWARQYAAANRIAMFDAIQRVVLDPLSIPIDRDSLIHLDHNHVQQELHDGRDLWVHRKGAQALLPDETSVIPGSMGTTTYVVSGRGSMDALNSCSHGAGRAMSRKEAFSKLSTKVLQREMNGVWFDERKNNRLVDESPSAYKDIRNVMKAQKDLVRIIDQRQPILNFKAG